MKKVLVTGATGFIGGYVITELLKKGYQVIASSSNPERAQQMEWYTRISYIPFDLSDYNAPTNYFQHFGAPELMIHLAWEGLPNYKAPFHVEQNLPRHFSFIENLVQNGLNDLTITGTCFEYGMVEGRLSEDMDTHPANSYAIAKDSLRRRIEELATKKDFNFKWVRLFYMYGKGQNPNSLLSQLDKALENEEPVFNMSGGEQQRDYLPVEKVAEYLVQIATQQAVRGIINCCSGKPVQIKSFVEEYLSGKDSKIQLNLGYYPYADYEPMIFWGDTKKLKSIIDNE